MLIGGAAGWLEALFVLGLKALGEDYPRDALSIWNFMKNTLLIGYAIYILLGLKTIVVTPQSVDGNNSTRFDQDK